jgi:hypothetical protein
VPYGITVDMSHDHAQTKRHAQLRHAPRARPFWVGDPDDWKIVRRHPRPPLVCPEPGCDLELVSYENHNNRRNPRVFKFKAGAKPCGHWRVEGLSGGPESAQHQWMKRYLAKIATRYGYTAIPEHHPTRADVYVQEPAYCLEVQLVPTQFVQRTKARTQQGAQVCWFVRDGLDTRKARAAVFQGPGIRFRVVEAADRERPAAPWDAPEEEGQPVRVQVFASIARAPRPSDTLSAKSSGLDWFVAGRMDADVFLKEILSGRRHWHRPGVVHPNRGYWILDTDLTSYREYKHKQKAALAATEGLPESAPDTALVASPLSTPSAAGVPEPAPKVSRPAEIRTEPKSGSVDAASDLPTSTRPPESSTQPPPDQNTGRKSLLRSWLAWLKRSS